MRTTLIHRGAFLIPALACLLTAGADATAQYNPYRDAPNPYTAEPAQAPPVVRWRGSDPPSAELLSGKRLNELLGELQKHRGEPTLPDLRLTTKTLRHLNLKGKSGVQVGMLRWAGCLSWPEALREGEYARERGRVDSLLAKAVGQMRKEGRVRPAVLKRLGESAQALSKQLEDNAGDVSPSQYIEARRFLNSLQDGVKPLRDPAVRDLLACAEELPAKVRSASDLVRYMTEKKLTFGPGLPEDRAAYETVAKALADHLADRKEKPKRK